ncbi:MAG: ABC transporter ATP-binding protein [Thermoguttaceae bacterium]
MKKKNYRNLLRGMRVSFTYWRAIILAVSAALLVGVLWGGNIAVLIYPVIEIAYKKKTFTVYVDEKIAAADAELQQLQALPLSDETKVAHLAHSKVLWAEWKLNAYRYARPWVEKYTPHSPYQTVVFLVIIALVGTLLKACVVVVHTLLTTHIVTSTLCLIRERFFATLLRYEVNYFSQTGTSEAMSRFLGDTGTLASGFGVIYGTMIREPVKLLVCISVAAYISWPLLLVTLIVVPLAFFAVRWIAKSLRRIALASMQEMVRVFGRLDESVRSIRIVKAFTQERYERAKFHRINKKVYKWAMKGAKYDALTQPLTEILGIVMMSLAILVGVYLLLTQRLSIFGIPMMSRPMDEGSLLLFYAMLAGAAEPARKLTGIFQSFQAAAVAADRVYAMLDRDIPLVDPPHPRVCPRHHESLRFENVQFYYNADKPVLRGIDLVIPFGETIAFVGPNGCGKSTLLSLIPRFADPTGGRVLLDGVPLTEVRQRNLRQQMGIVTQDTILFGESVLENIRYGNMFASREEVIDAAKRAFAHEFIIEELSDGYETEVGQGGSRLSGGQRQRIALARAILRDPAIFLLDEATSQIDLSSEHKIHQAMANFVGKRTTIIVTHRLSAISLADRIAVIQNGVIADCGTHNDLFGKNEYYTKLYRSQEE